MAKATKPDEDTRTQRQKFIDAARKHGAEDVSAETFRKAVRGVAVRVTTAKKTKSNARPPKR